IGVLRATLNSSILFLESAYMGADPENSLPAIVREGLVRVGHAVRFFALLHGSAAVLRSFEQFGSELARHRVLAALARGLDHPAHRERDAARRAHFDRYLVRGATDAARLDLDRRRDVAERLLHEFDRR